MGLKKSSTERTVREVTFYIRDANKFPLACVIVVPVEQIEHKDNAVTFAVGISVHNPNDRFDAALGRRIAAGRADALVRRRDGFRSDKSFLTAPVARATATDRPLLINAIKEAMFHNAADGRPSLPQRIVRRIKLDLDSETVTLTDGN